MLNKKLCATLVAATVVAGSFSMAIFADTNNREIKFDANNRIQFIKKGETVNVTTTYGAITFVNGGNSVITGSGLEITGQSEGYSEIKLGQNTYGVVVTDTVKPSKVTFDNSKLNMYVGDTKTVTANVEPLNADLNGLSISEVTAKGATAKLTIDNKKLVDGKLSFDVKATETTPAGTYNIQVKSGSVNLGNVQVNVFNKITGMTLNVKNPVKVDYTIAGTTFNQITKVQLEIKKSFTPSFNFTPNTKTTKLANKNVTLISYNPSIAKIDGGKIVGVNEGDVLIKAISNDNPEVYQYILVNVYRPNLSSIKVVPAKNVSLSKITVGDTKAVEVQLNPLTTGQNKVEISIDKTDIIQFGTNNEQLGTNKLDNVTIENGKLTLYIKGIKDGTVNLTIKSKDNTSKYITSKITIIKPATATTKRTIKK